MIQRPDSLAACLQGMPRSLVRLSVAEIRRLLWRLVWMVLPPQPFVRASSRWRRHHQAVARHYDYQRRLNDLL